MRGGRLAALMALPLAVLLVGCGGGGASPASSPPPSEVAGAAEPGAALVGLWKVRAEGEGDSTWVVLTAGGFTVERDRRLIDGSLATGDDQLLAMVVSWQGGAANRSVPWLTSAHSFRQDGSSRLLLSEDGAVLATLTPAEQAPHPIGALPELMDPPMPSPALTRALLRPTPAPTPGPSLAPTDVHGTWTAGSVAGVNSIPLLTLDADGTYRTSDGCNGTGGTWRLIDGNRVLTTIGGQAGVGCPVVVDVPGWFLRTRTIGVVGDVLTLYDRAGTAIGSLRRR